MTTLTAKEFRLRGFGQPVYCAGALPDEDAPDEGRSLVVIISHGFASSKNGAMAQLLLQYVLDAGYGCIAYDFPAHGPHKEENGALTIHGCKSNLMLVEEYVRRKVPGAKIGYFGSSFGAYITLLHLLDVKKFAAINAPDPEPTAAFLRSAAVDMPDIMAGYDSPEIRDLMATPGYLLSVGGPDEVRMTPRFFEELAENDLFAACREADGGSLAECLGTPIRMVHATTDEVVDPERARAVAGEVGIPVTWFEGEDHTLSTFPETPGKVCEMAMDFFRE